MTNAAFRADVAEFCRRLRRRQVDGPGPCARGTADLLRRLIAGGRHPDPASLLEEVRQWGVAMQAAHPMGEWGRIERGRGLDVCRGARRERSGGLRRGRRSSSLDPSPTSLSSPFSRTLPLPLSIYSELAIGNIVRRVLHMVREEAQEEDGYGSGGGAAALFGGGCGPGAFPGEGKGGGGHDALSAPSSSSSGLLSRALRPVAAPGRVVSLHNLLAASPGRDGGGGGPPQLQPPSPGGGGAEGRPSAPAPPPPTFATPGGSSEEEDEEEEDEEEESGSDGSATPPPRAAAAAPPPPTRTSSRRGRPPWTGKAGVIDALNELIEDLADMDASIALRAGEYVHANEVVLTLGACPAVQRFLVEAGKKRDFQVVVAEGSCPGAGHAAAAALARAGVSTTLIADSAIFAVASRANKVLLGASALLANGGILAPAGGHLLALAAARHAAPLVVLVGMHQLSPLFPHDPALAVNDFGPPADVLPYAAVAAPVAGGRWAGDCLGGGVGGMGMGGVASPRAGGGTVRGGGPAGSGAAQASAASAPTPPGPPPLHVHAPRVDYVPPELIALFVTDTGGYTPSYVYRLLAEYYSRADYALG